MPVAVYGDYGFALHLFLLQRQIIFEYEAFPAHGYIGSLYQRWDKKYFP